MFVAEKHQVADLMLSMRAWRCADAVRPPAMLLHGMGDTAGDWDQIADSLCGDRSVIAVDLRGHGHSGWPGRYSIALMAQDVRELLRVLGMSQVDLIGHSLGALAACVVAADSPCRIRRLVLEDIGLLYPREPTTPRRPEVQLPFDWGVVEQVRPEIDNPAPEWPVTIAGIRAPTLVISGGEQSFVPADRVQQLVEVLPHSTLTVIEAGHEVHATCPGAYLRALRTFLDQPVGGGDSP